MKKVMKEIGETMIGGFMFGVLMWFLFQTATLMYAPH